MIEPLRPQPDSRCAAHSSDVDAAEIPHRIVQQIEIRARIVEQPVELERADGAHTPIVVDYDVIHRQPFSSSTLPRIRARFALTAPDGALPISR
jgi:hypothetical protein